MPDNNRVDKAQIRIKTASKEVFQMAAQHAGMTEIELVSRILEDWSVGYLRGERQLPPPRVSQNYEDDGQVRGYWTRLIQRDDNSQVSRG